MISRNYAGQVLLFSWLFVILNEVERNDSNVSEDGCHQFYSVFVAVFSIHYPIIFLTFLFACPKRKVTKEKRHFYFKRSAKIKEAILLLPFILRFVVFCCELLLFFMVF